MEQVKRSAFWFYRSYYESVKDLPDDMAGRMFKAICLYMLDGADSEMVGAEEFIWKAIKPSLLINKNKVEAGRKGGLKKAENRNRNSSKPLANSSTSSKPLANSSTSSKPLANSSYVENRDVESRDVENRDVESRDVGDVEECPSSLRSEANSSLSNLPFASKAAKGASFGSANDPAPSTENPPVLLQKEKKTDFDFTAFAKFFNSELDKANSTIPRIRKITGRRKEYIRSRIREYSKEDLATVVRKAAASDFLNGRSDSGWIAEFTWIFRPNNFPKILEGNYDNDRRYHQNNGLQPPGNARHDPGYGTKAEFNAEALRRTEAAILRVVQGVEDPEPNF